MNFRFVESTWIFFFSMTVLSTFATRTTFEHCPKGWHYYDQRQRCILLEYKLLPWERARDKCQEYGCDLTTIRDSQTSAFITGLIEDPNCSEYWIGLHDRNSEGFYQWLDESGATNFTYWAEGEPNNLGNEDCVFISAGKGRRWNDGVCDAYIGYSCDCAAENKTIHPTSKFERRSSTTPIPVGDTSTTPKPVVDTITTPTPVVDTITTPTPVVDTITTPKPVVDTITTPTPVVDTITTPKPVVDTITTPKPVVDTITTPKPVVDTITTPKPVVDTITTPKPVVDTITTPTPFVDTTTTPTPVVDTTTTPSIVGQCPADWHYYHPRHRCFKHRTNYMSWTGAKDRCKSYGHRLAIIPDIDTNNFLTGIVQGNKWSKIWIGLHRLNSANFFQWLDEDVEAQFTNWNESDPDIPYPNPAGVYMIPALGHWFDDDSTARYAMFCEQAATFNED